MNMSNMPNPIPYLIQQRSMLLQLPSLTPQQQQQLTAIQLSLQKISGMANAQNPNLASMASSAGISSAPSMANQIGNNMQARPSLSTMPQMNGVQAPSQQQLQQQPQQQAILANLNLLNGQLPANLTPQQRMLLAQMGQLQAQQQVNQSSPKPNTLQAQQQLMQQLLSQQQQQRQQATQSPQQQQQQQQQGLHTQPIWTGQIVWHINGPDNNLQEFSCHCSAFAITLRGFSVSMEE
jgi:hypothetical protein